MKQYRRPILLVPFINLFYWSAIYLYTPTLPNFARSNGAGSQMTGMIIGAFGLAQMVFRLPFGLVSDRVRRRKPFVCIGMATAGLGALIAALFPSSPGLLLARTVAGIGASVWVNFTVLFPAYYAEDQTDQAVSRLNAYCSFSASLTMLLGGCFVGLWGQSTTSFIAAGCGLAAFLLSLGLSDHRPAPSHS